MSRWIALGLRTGIKTSPFPARDDAGAQTPTSIAVDAQALDAGQALEAAALCPSGAIEVVGSVDAGQLNVDTGRCVMCQRCWRRFPTAFRPLTDPKVAVRNRSQLRLQARWREGSRLEPEAIEMARTLDERSQRVFGRSLHIRHVDAGSCNGCESELQLLQSPYYDLQRLGFFFTPSPRHADALLVTGVVTSQMEGPLVATYEAIPAPKLVIAAGVCAVGGGLFADGPTTRGPLDRLLPVDVYVPGCPPSPLALLHGLLLAVGRAEERHGGA
jgi:formate hydrogenlyase subunit 7